MKSANSRNRQLRHIDSELRRLWHLGRNAVVGWRPTRRGVEVLFVPQYLAPDLLSGRGENGLSNAPLTSSALRALADICQIEPYTIEIPASAQGRPGKVELARVLRRYGIARTDDRAVLLFDIVGFSRYAPLEQVAILSGLAYSINIAEHRAQEHGLQVELASTTTGDGFFVWNRLPGLTANVDLFCVLMLALAENATARRRTIAGCVPELRSVYHLGSCYEYFGAATGQSSDNSFIVGDVTVAMSRICTKALAEQILMGEFTTAEPVRPHPGAAARRLHSGDYMDLVVERLRLFESVPLGAERVTQIKAYFTGNRRDDDTYDACRYVVTDKHGFEHPAFNVKVNVHHARGEPVYLGRQTQALTEFEAREIARVVPLHRG